VGDGACTFVMSTAEGGGLPVVLVPLTKPAQPVITPSGASDANNRSTSHKKEEQEDARWVECPPHRFNNLTDAIAIFPRRSFPALALGLFGEKKKRNSAQGTIFSTISSRTIVLGKFGLLIAGGQLVSWSEIGHRLGCPVGSCS
jgi:hypothetical protein